MLKYKFINNNIQGMNNNHINNNYQNSNSNINLNNNNNLYKDKLKYAEQLIILIQFYIKEIKNFPSSINPESSYIIKAYIEELIFATHEICTKIYYNKGIFNKILPFYYKLILEFIHKQNIFIKILQDLEKQPKIEPSKYTYLINKMNLNKD